MSQAQRTILVIDDNDADRHFVRRYLQRDTQHRYIFRDAETGEQALVLCHTDPPDCILVDYNLPDMSGLELLGELKDKNDQVLYPVVIMTGEGDELVAVQAIQGGAQDYLVKGKMTPEALVVAVDNAIEKVRLRQSLDAQQRYLEQQNKELQRRQDEIQDLNNRLQRGLSESHHRIKNNLQILASLVNMYTIDCPEMVPVGALKRLEKHIQTLASLHDLLTHEAKTEADFDTVNLKALLDKMAPIIEVTAGERPVRITAESIVLPLQQASAFLLLVNELLSNALKHGKGEILLTLYRVENSAHLEIADDGPGFPPDFNPRRAANTGLELLESISSYDLSGTISYETQPKGGALVRVTFPLKSEVSGFRAQGSVPEGKGS